jgi:hypothetical protein
MIDKHHARFDLASQALGSSQIFAKDDAGESERRIVG